MNDVAKKAPGKRKSSSNVPRVVLTAVDRVRLRAETMCSEPTIRKWASGAPVTEATTMRLEKAARKLGIAVSA